MRFPTIRKFSTAKDDHGCHGAPSTFTLLFIAKDAMRLERRGRAHGYSWCQAQAVPGGTGAEQPPRRPARAERAGEGQQHHKDQGGFAVTPSPAFVPSRSQDRLGEDPIPDTLSQRERSDACNRGYKERALW